MAEGNPRRGVRVTAALLLLSMISTDYIIIHRKTMNCLVGGRGHTEQPYTLPSNELQHHLTDFQRNKQSNSSTSIIAIHQQEQDQQWQTERRGRPRVLMGIFCRKERDEQYQAMFRLLFDNDPRACSLGQYERDLYSKNESQHCQLVYTFVMGGNEHTGAPTEIVDNRTLPVLLEKGDDHVILNIKENMEDGKSQTWLYFASTIMDEENLHFDYVGKMDTDTMLYLDLYFSFAETYLTPAPYNVRTIVGLLADKAWWRRADEDEEQAERRHVKERFFEEVYPGHHHGEHVGMHIYPSGQLYILSKDLVAGVVDVARIYASMDSINATALERVEDHDVSVMAYISAEGLPMHLIQLSQRSAFWSHGFKRKRKRWKKMWTDEINRTKNFL